MADINQVKLNRLKEHFNNDGAVTPAAVAKVLGAKAANVSFLRTYVEAADPGLLEEFDTASAAPEPQAKAETPAVPQGSAPNRIPAPDEIQSQPESSLPVQKPEAQQSSPPAEPGATPPSAGALKFRLRKEDGTASELRIVAQKGSTVILEAAPEVELVNVLVRGITLSVDLNDLKNRASESLLTIGEVSLPVSTWIMIAEAAKA